MPKAYRVKPRLARNRQGYVANFRDASNRRRHCGLGTRDASDAGLICTGLEYLRRRKILSPAEIPPGTRVHAVAIALYFGTQKPRGSKVHTGTGRPGIDHEGIARHAAQFPLDAQADARELLLDREDLRLRLQEAEDALELERKAHEKTAKELDALRASYIGRAIEAGKRVPAFDDALRFFEEHLRSQTTHGNVKAHMSTARNFAAWLAARPRPPKTPLDVTPDDVAAWLDERVNERRSPKPLEYRRGLHIKLARFVNWAAGRYGYTSQMGSIDFPKRVRLDRERGDVHWHTKAEVEAAIAALPDRLPKAFKYRGAALDEAALAKASAYWSALVATLAYGGLQLAELCWLRGEDLDLAAGSLRITTVEVEGARHHLKTGHRTRTVNLEAEVLLPRLRAHLAAGGAGEVHLFPMPAIVRRRPRGGAKPEGHPERWIENALSGALRGHKANAPKAGGAGRGRPAKLGLLPEGMSPLSLRRTAGSLLLRSGKSVEEVAAFLGNTPEVCRRHYARILGAEVKVDLSGLPGGLEPTGK